MVMLHWLGGGAQTWAEFGRGMAGRGMRCVALDLPGFGEAAGVSGYTVEAMAGAVVEAVRRLRGGKDGPWLLAGHSMGGKVAAVVARRAMDGAEGLAGLRGLVLVSASPAGPEPMEERTRREMLDALGESTGDAGEDRNRAGKFVDDNVGKLALRAEVRERAVEGVVGMNRTAFRAWLEAGSKEDWSDRVGVLDLPALVFAGSEDGPLGVAGQRELAMGRLPQGELVVLEGAGHLAPIERPGELVEYVTQFVTKCGLALRVRESAPGAEFRALMHSERTSPATRAVMEERLAARANWNGGGAAFSAAEMRCLRALVERVVPGAGFDVAAEVDAQMKDGAGDGWRFAALPGDAAAWRRGLRSLEVAAKREHEVGFAALPGEMQDGLLRMAREGEMGRGVLGALHVGEGAEAFDGAEMKLWFEDVRGVCAQAYMADPRTMERVGFTGFADDLGFTQIELGQREEFERGV